MQNELKLFNIIAISLNLIFSLTIVLFFKDIIIMGFPNTTLEISTILLTIFYFIILIYYLIISIVIYRKNIELNRWIKIAAWVNIISIVLAILITSSTDISISQQIHNCKPTGGAECGIIGIGFVVVAAGTYVSISVIYIITFILSMIGYKSKTKQYNL